MKTKPKPTPAFSMLRAMMRDIVCEPHGRSLYADWLEDQGLDAAAWRARPDRVGRLTPEQLSLLPAWRDYWLGVARRTSREPLDLPAVRAALADAYGEAGLAPPERVIALGSPLALGAAYAAYRKRFKDRNPHLLESLNHARKVTWGPRAEVEVQVKGLVEREVRSALRVRLRNRVSRRAISGGGVLQTISRTHSAVANSSLGDLRRYNTWGGVSLPGEAGDLAYHSYLWTVAGLAVCGRLAPLMRLWHLVGGLLPFDDGTVVVTPVPAAVTMERNRVIGAEYPDGFSWRRGEDLTPPTPNDAAIVEQALAALS